MEIASSQPKYVEMQVEKLQLPAILVSCCVGYFGGCTGLS